MSAGYSHNIQVRVSSRGGWISMLQGESQGRALERMLPDLNRQGYRVAFVVDDKFSIGKRILNVLVATSHLGFTTKPKD